ncbi:MAG: S9 family peptidase [Candidatus Eisenbacteria bacterium]
MATQKVRSPKSLRPRATRASAGRSITPEDLWKLPRVGAPVPSPDGRCAIVPVTTYSLETNAGTSRLWLVQPPTARRAGRSARPKAEALTRADVSSSNPVFHPTRAEILFLRKPGSGSGAKNEGEAQLYRLSLEGGEPERLTDMPFAVIDPRWFPDGRRVAFLSAVFTDAPALEATAKRKAERATDPVQARVTEDRVYRYWDHWLTDGTALHLFVLDTKTCEVVDLTPTSALMFDPDDPTGQYKISPSGEEIIFGATKSKPPHSPWQFGLYRIKVPARPRPDAKPSPIRALIRGLPGHEFNPLYSRDGRYLFFVLQERWDFYAANSRLAVIDLTSGERTILTSAWDRSVSSYSFDEGGDLIYLTVDDAGASSTFTFDWRRAIERPGKVKPRHLVGGMSMSAPKAAGGRLFFALASIQSPPEAYSMDRRGRELTRLTFFTEEILSGLTLSASESVIFSGAEGDLVQMYLVYPPGEAARVKSGARGKRLPLLQVIHGGPHGAFGNEWFWRWNAQTFAAQGYLVAMVNFHGSTGWGEEFCASILGRWGDQPYQDIMLATDWLIARGLADPKRMAAAGGSYGGYMAAWIASQTNRFRCIINHAGVSDLQTQYASDVTQGRSVSMGGEPWDRIEGMDRWNPLRHAKGFRSPMLISHGVQDFRVPYGHALETYNVYKAMGKKARLVVFPDENHWILKAKNSLFWYGEVFAWLDRWLKPRRGRKR